MTSEYVLYLSRETLSTAILILSPLLGAGLLVGLTVGVFQAVTQINEMTLTFIPKMAAVGLVLMLLIPWFLDILLSFTRELYAQIPLMVN
ncbi:MAG: flagellar biosynthesis protein FliQ [Candidatus Marinimicrobia bacterium]|nr:flagellar biosynthesis protein FliQ [Candidatus Neomarinimicrobiota bacterium]